jgi:hypothetical protein
MVVTNPRTVAEQRAYLLEQLQRFEPIQMLNLCNIISSVIYVVYETAERFKSLVRET